MPEDTSFSFYALPQRIHPAASRIQSPVTGNRFRHGTKLLRWRPDKSPEQCKMDQLAKKKPICSASSNSIQFTETRQALLQR